MDSRIFVLNQMGPFIHVPFASYVFLSIVWFLVSWSWCPGVLFFWNTIQLKIYSTFIAVNYRVFCLPRAPLIFLMTRSHVNSSRIFPSVRIFTGILYLENLGGIQLQKTPCRFSQGCSRTCSFRFPFVKNHNQQF